MTWGLLQFFYIFIESPGEYGQVAVTKTRIETVQVTALWQDTVDLDGYDGTSKMDILQTLKIEITELKLYMLSATAKLN